MTIGTLKSPNPRNRNSISVIKSKFLSVSSMNTLLAILKVTDARRDVILAGGLYHRFPERHLLPLESTVHRISYALIRKEGKPMLFKQNSKVMFHALGLSTLQFSRQEITRP